MFTEWLCKIILTNCLEIGYLTVLYLIDDVSFETLVAINIVADVILLLLVGLGLRPKNNTHLQNERKELWIFQLIVVLVVIWGGICFSFGSRTWKFVAAGSIMGFTMIYDAIMMLRFCYRMKESQIDPEFEMKEISDVKSRE
jgi:hypothetical protein